MATNDLAIGTGEGVTKAPLTATFGRLTLPAAEANRLSDRALIERLVESGRSRLTAARIVETTRGQAEVGRARRRGPRFGR
jgi:hypothetical protein